MLPLAVLLTGDPVPLTRELRGGFGALIRGATGDAWNGPWLEIDCRGSDPLPPPDSVAGIIVSGSPASVTSLEPWMTRACDYLAVAVSQSTPVLGICFGHQMLGHALGGKVDKNPRGREIGTVEVQLDGADALLDAEARPFLANMTHVDSVVELPAGACVLARTELEPHAAVRFADTAWGVQFHPEVDGEVMRHYLRARAELLREEGFDPEELERTAGDAQPGAAVLARFAQRVAGL